MHARPRDGRTDVLADKVDVVTKTQANGETVLELNPTAVQRNKLRVDARKWAASKPRLKLRMRLQICTKVALMLDMASP